MSTNKEMKNYLVIFSGGDAEYSLGNSMYEIFKATDLEDLYTKIDKYVDDGYGSYDSIRKYRSYDEEAQISIFELNSNEMIFDITNRKTKTEIEDELEEQQAKKEADLKLLQELKDKYEQHPNGRGE